MTLSASQIRTARSLLRWTAPTIAKRSQVAFATVLKAQLDAEIHAVSGADLRAIRAAFDEAGVEFLGDGSVQLRKAHRKAAGTDDAN